MAQKRKSKKKPAIALDAEQKAQLKLLKEVHRLLIPRAVQEYIGRGASIQAYQPLHGLLREELLRTTAWAARDRSIDRLRQHILDIDPATILGGIQASFEDLQAGLRGGNRIEVFAATDEPIDVAIAVMQWLEYATRPQPPEPEPPPDDRLAASAALRKVA